MHRIRTFMPVDYPREFEREHNVKPGKRRTRNPLLFNKAIKHVALEDLYILASAEARIDRLYCYSAFQSGDRDRLLAEYLENIGSSDLHITLKVWSFPLCPKHYDAFCATTTGDAASDLLTGRCSTVTFEFDVWQRQWKQPLEGATRDAEAHAKKMLGTEDAHCCGIVVETTPSTEVEPDRSAVSVHIRLA
ncbi:hypothetical protein CC86DRAFT_415726 [Ophiobolus disseminans]|uniref:Uncharacterized protein n=1 Tax=Ophiobolus disseminans TaxID=1469910 RepID=A0A6A7AML8_9PLEO|nr:hypothetical protein CC86DRAFT_415726 [Ophiobolus disseminans]